MCVCVCVHVYAHVRANVLVCVCVPECIYVFVDVCMCMCLRMRMFVCLRCVRAHARPRVHLGAYKNVFVYDFRTTPPHRNIHLFVCKR